MRDFQKRDEMNKSLEGNRRKVCSSQVNSTGRFKLEREFKSNLFLLLVVHDDDMIW